MPDRHHLSTHPAIILHSRTHIPTTHHQHQQPTPTTRQGTAQYVLRFFGFPNRKGCKGIEKSHSVTFRGFQVWRRVGRAGTVRTHGRSLPGRRSPLPTALPRTSHPQAFPQFLGQRRDRRMYPSKTVTREPVVPVGDAFAHFGHHSAVFNYRHLAVGVRLHGGNDLLGQRRSSGVPPAAL